MARPKLCIAILAAGSSQRFGEKDKLAQDLGGQMLGLHMAERLTGLEAANRVIIGPSATHSCTQKWEGLGYAVLPNPNAAEGMGSSVAMAAEFALNAKAEILLIALADMPLVPLAHCEAMTAEMAEKKSEVIATKIASRAMPPALFRASIFPQLTALTGDQGARAIIGKAPTIELQAELAIDIDTPQDLAKARAFCGDP